MSPLLDLSLVAWTLTGWRPSAWRFRKSAPAGFLTPDIGPLPARLPGSVQENLRRAGLIPDWHIGRNSLAVEWVEHRQWMFVAALPDLGLVPGESVDFWAERLDYRGQVLVDEVVVGEFCGAHLPVRLPLGPALSTPGPHTLAIVFDLPPEAQGQLGQTSLAREQKPRFSFGWDWCPRFIPIGAGGGLGLDRTESSAVQLHGTTTALSPDLRLGTVTFHLATTAPAEISAELHCQGQSVATLSAALAAPGETYSLALTDPQLWWPNGEGPQPLYELKLSAKRTGRTVAEWTRSVGFKHVAWQPCPGAPPDALPWLCVVNQRPIFLQGVNWTPARLSYLDTTAAEVEHLAGLYRDLGCNLLRVWGGGYLESPEFFAACDRLGLLVWQEFPLSSSGVDSDPPRDDAFIAEICAVARHFIRSRQHHASLLQWCGGNELHAASVVAGPRRLVPLDLGHPLLAALAALVAQEDSVHRFLPTSPYGPRVHATTAERGQGLHHEVHGPWSLDGFSQPGDWEEYWSNDDALFRGETGLPSASRLELMRRYAGGEPLWPPTTPLWQHASGWWTQWDRLGPKFSGEDAEKALAAYVEFTRQEQAEKLAGALRAKKRQFPRCGGFLIWMGHDVFPCLANTSIIEFDHRPKPAAHAVAQIFHLRPENVP